jgi:hypothetical protein
LAVALTPHTVRLFPKRRRKASIVAYQIMCDSHGYGQSFQVWDEVKQDKDLHVANNPGCEYAVEIHEATSGGGYEVIEGSDGSQLPDQ